MSGFVRPSIVGPCDENGSRPALNQQAAPTASACGDDAGSSRLPDSTLYWSGPAVVKRSKRGAAVALSRRIATEKPFSALLGFV